MKTRLQIEQPNNLKKEGNKVKTLQELITNEMVERIENELNRELQKLEVDIKNKETIIYDDYSETEYLVGELSNEYFIIPLIELKNLIGKMYPFVNELSINIIPNMEYNYSESSQIAKASITHFFTDSELDSLTDDQYEEFQQLLDDLVEIYDDMRIRISVELESADSEQQDEELLRVIDIW